MGWTDNPNAKNLIADQHVHNYERWFGKLTPAAGGKVATLATLDPFIIDAGNNAYGAEVLIADVNDWTTHSNVVALDMHRIYITDAERTSVYRVRFTWGTGTFAAATALGHYTEVLFRTNATNSDRAPIDLRMPRIAPGTKVWASCWCADNTGTLEFLYGLHGYTVAPDMAF